MHLLRVQNAPFRKIELLEGGETHTQNGMSEEKNFGERCAPPSLESCYVRLLNQPLPPSLGITHSVIALGNPLQKLQLLSVQPLNGPPVIWSCREVAGMTVKNKTAIFFYGCLWWQMIEL